MLYNKTGKSNHERLLTPYIKQRVSTSKTPPAVMAAMSAMVFLDSIAFVQ